MSKKQYLFIITHFDGDAARRREACEARRRRGLIPKSFPPVAELLKTFLEAGGRIGVYPPCAKTHGVTQEDRVPNAEFMGGAAVIGAAEYRQTFSF